MKTSISIHIFNAMVIFYFLPLLTYVNCDRYCYSCATKANDMTCLHNPQNATDSIVPCKHYCTISRIEYAYSPVVIFINRSCETTAVDGIAMDNYFIIYNRSCKKNLCNVGDGKESYKNLGDESEDEVEPLDTLEVSSASDIQSFYQLSQDQHFCFLLLLSVSFFLSKLL